jgi:DNA repair exonuclease SbcCD ATPase subunit
MKILSLYLENFKSTVKADLKFDKRIILLEGKAGQGKTTVLEAIVYALTDNLNEKVSEFMRLKQFPFVIKMEFEHLLNNYKIEINCKKDGNGVEKRLVINNDENNVYKNSSATKKLAEIINPTITKYSAVSEQGKSTLLLFQKPAERLKQFKEILGIDNIAFIVGKIKEDIKANENTIDVTKAELNVLQNKSFSFQDIPEIIDNENELKSEIEKLEIEKNLYEVHNKVYEKYLIELKNYNDAQNNISLNNINLKAYNSELDVLKESLKIVPEYDSNILNQLYEQVSSIEKEKIQYDNQLKNYNDAQIKINTLTQKIDRLKERQKKFIQKDIPTIESKDELNNIIESIKNNTVKGLNLQQKITLVEQGKCPTCGQEFKDFNLGDLKNELDVLHILLKELNSKKVKIEEGIKLYNDIVNENKQNEIKFNADQESITENEKEIIELQKIINPEKKVFGVELYYLNIQKQKDLKKQYDEVIEQNKKVNENVTRFQNAIIVTEEKIKDLEKIVEPELVKEPEKFNSLNFDNVKKSLTILQEKKKEIERIIQYNESIRIEKEENDKVIKTKESEIESLYATNRILENSKVILDKDFSSFIIDKGSIFIRDKMNDFFRRAYGRYEVTFQQDKNSIDFFYNEAGEIPRPVTMASGFERQILSISLRIALCSLQRLGIMICDEIDSDASSENSLDLFNTLLNEPIETFFIITHNDDVKEFIEQRQDSQKFSFQNGKVLN